MVNRYHILTGNASYATTLGALVITGGAIIQNQSVRMVTKTFREQKKIPL